MNEHAPNVPPGGAPTLARLAYNRLGFGARPGDPDFNDTPSLNAYIDQQLAFESIADTDCDAFLAAMDRTDDSGTYQIPPLDATVQQIYDYVRATTAYGPGELANFLRLATYVRALLSKRQLFETMVDFWSSHLNNTTESSEYKYWDDYQVSRQFALGNFRDLIGASAKSPSMLEYLSNRYSDGDNPNENYSRELLELHSMGTTVRIPGHPRFGEPNYSEADVHALAQILSGWTNTRTEFEEFEFNDSAQYPSHHWPPKELYFGGDTPHMFAYGGAEQGEIALDIIAEHESTAWFVSFKLCKRFVSDDPVAFCPNVILAGMAAFQATHGDIRETLRAILKADFPGHDFKSSWGQKIKRPFEFMMSAARAMNAQTWPPPFEYDTDWELEQLIEGLGQVLFTFPPPIGFPDVKFAWMNTNHVFGRWTLGNLLVRRYFGELTANLSRHADEPAATDAPTASPPNADLDALIGATPGPPLNATQVVDRLIAYFMGRTLHADDRAYLISYLGGGGNPNAITSTNVNLRPVIGVLIASPYFQWR